MKVEHVYLGSFNCRYSYGYCDYENYHHCTIRSVIIITITIIQVPKSGVGGGGGMDFN